MNITCPHCNIELPVQAVSQLLADQTLRMFINYSGASLQAVMISEVIKNFEIKAVNTVADTHVRSIEMKDGKLDIEFVVTSTPI